MLQTTESRLIQQEIRRTTRRDDFELRLVPRCGAFLVVVSNAVDRSA